MQLAFVVATGEDGSAAWFGGAGRVGDAVGGGVTMGWRVSWGHSSWRLSRQKQLPRNHIPVPSYSDNQSRLSPARRFNQSWIRIRIAYTKLLNPFQLSAFFQYHGSQVFTIFSTRLLRARRSAYR